MRVKDSQVAWVTGLFTTLTLLLFCFFPDSWLVRYPFTDDAFYYAQIARNIALGAGSTFDGIHETNGYHPLWMLFWIPLYKVWGMADWMPLRVILGIQAVLAGLTSFFLYHVFRRWVSAFWAAASVVLYQLLAFLLEISFSGMETGLQGCLVALLLYQWPKLVREDSFRSVWLGLLLGLIILARLDGGVVALVVGGWSLLELRRWGWLLWARRMSVVAGTALITVAPYFVWNLSHFGHLMPVSGAAKQYAFWEHSWLEVLGKAFWWLKALVVGLESLGIPASVGWVGTFAILGIGLGILWYQRHRLGVSEELGLLIGAGVLHNLITSLLLHTFRGWYLVTEILALSGVLAFLVQLSWANARLARVFWPVLYSMLYLLTLGWIREWRLSPVANAVIWEAYQVGLWLRHHTAPEDRCASWDAGVIGYFSHRKVINLDGLVNDYQFLALSEAELPQYLLGNKVKYLTTYFLGTDWDSYWRFNVNREIWAHLLREPVYIRRFSHRAPSVFFRSTSGAYSYYIWRIPSDE